MNSALGIVIGLALLSCIFWILGAGVCRLMKRQEDLGFLWLLGLAACVVRGISGQNREK